MPAENAAIVMMIFGRDRLERLPNGCSIMFSSIPRRDPRKHVAGQNLKQVTDVSALETIVDDIIAKNPDKVGDAKSNPKAIGWFVGQVMKTSGGKANPQVVNELLKKRLGV